MTSGATTVGHDRTTFSVSHHGSSTLEQLNVMRSSESLTDVVLRVEGRDIPCHRVVLAAISPYFKAMFSYGLRESHERTVPILGVSADVMEIIVGYVYTGKCMLRKVDVAEVMVTADLFQIIPLKNAAVRFMIDCLDANNCLAIRRLAEKHTCDELCARATEYARSHFKDVVRQEEFVEMDANSLLSYLSDDELSVTKEDAVFDAAMRWLRYAPERQKYADIVLDAVRLPFVSPDYLKTCVAGDPLLSQTDACRRQVDEARTFQTSGKFRDDYDSTQLRPRKCTSKEVLIVFGGESRVGNFHECVHDVSYYDPTTKKWATLALVPGTLNTQAFGAVSLGYDIYITGGAVDNKAVKDVRVFYTYLNKWCNVSPMLQARYHHSAVVVGNQVYAVGGTDGSRCLDHVERYEPTSNAWTKVEPLVHAVKCPAVAAYEGKLYVFGGFSDTYLISQSIQVYNPESCSWIALSCPQIDYTCAQAVALSHKIYLLGGCSKTVKAYDPETDAVTRVANMITKRDNCGATVVNGSIFVTGGVSESNGASLSSGERYCPRLDKWERITPMPSRLYRHGCVSIRIPVYRKESKKKERASDVEPEDEQDATHDTPASASTREGGV